MSDDSRSGFAFEKSYPTAENTIQVDDVVYVLPTTVALERSAIPSRSSFAIASVP
jgi:hypothetical protein